MISGITMQKAPTVGTTTARGVSRKRSLICLATIKVPEWVQEVCRLNWHASVPDARMPHVHVRLNVRFRDFRSTALDDRVCAFCPRHLLFEPGRVSEKRSGDDKDKRYTADHR